MGKAASKKRPRRIKPRSKPTRRARTVNRTRRRTAGGRTRRRLRYDAGMPVGIAMSTEAWSSSNRTAPSSFGQKFIPIEQGCDIRFEEAKALRDPVHVHFRAQTVASPPAFVAAIDKGRVWGMEGVVITPDDYVLGDVSWEFKQQYLVHNRHSIFRHWKPYPLKYAAGTVGHLAHVSSANYFHWLHDVLPRIGLIRRAGVEVDQYVFRGGEAPSYQDDLLNKLGIFSGMRLYTESDFHLLTEKLVVPSLVSRYVWAGYPLPVAYSKWACDFLRNELMDRRDVRTWANGGSRIYVSRAAARQRRLLNEGELTAMLTAYGFKVVAPETLPVRQQISLFAEADAIVAPHGAGLANLAFCAPGAKVIELFSPVYTPGYYWIISNNRSLEYYYLIGERYVRNPNIWDGGMDYFVNSALLERMLRKAGIG